MADRGAISWEDDTFYTEDQVAGVLRELGISVENETESNFLTYCPFHGNRDTPSFTVSKQAGVYFCFNPSCGRSGSLIYLIKTIGNKDDFQAKRIIAKNKLKAGNWQEQIAKVTESNDSWMPYAPKDDLHYMARVKKDMWEYAEGQLYMRDRGFEKITLKDFDVGYDKDAGMVCVPMHDPMGKVEVGAVRRSVKGKVFKNTPGLPTSKTLFNLHRAKRYGDSVVIVEASFSAMRLAQVGYPNSVAMLMGHFSKEHARLLGMYFNTITIMTDFDKTQIYKACGKCKKAGSNLCRGHNPGEELGQHIADTMSNKRVMWAHHGGSTRFPEGIKDPDDMDDETIRFSIKNAISHFEYTIDS